MAAADIHPLLQYTKIVVGIDGSVFITLVSIMCELTGARIHEDISSDRMHSNALPDVSGVN